MLALYGISFNMYHFFLKDFSIKNSSTNKGKSLLFYHQQMCKHSKKNKKLSFPRAPCSLSLDSSKFERQSTPECRRSYTDDLWPKHFRGNCALQHEVLVLLQLSMSSVTTRSGSHGDTACHIQPGSALQAATPFLWLSKALGRGKEG